MIALFKKPIDASRNFMGRIFHSAVKAERQRVKIQFAQKFRPLFLFSLVESVLGLLTLADAQRRKSWLSYLMGLMLFAVACGHAFSEIRDRKILDALADKLA